MKKMGFILWFLIFGLGSCKENDVIDDPQEDCISCQIASLNQADADKYLVDKLKEIQNLSTSVPCNDATEWLITPIGAKACGGPTGFIAYSTTIDKVAFLKKVADYTQAQNEYNKKWHVISDCSVPIAPTKVLCQDGKPKLTN